MFLPLFAAIVTAFLCLTALTRAEDVPPGEVPEAPLQESDREHWAFYPLTRPAVPEVRQGDWCRNAVDRFILAKLEEKGLSPLAEAGRRELLRRATYDLTGVPPTPAEMEAFLADEQPDAFERAVDRLLAGDAYAERQAQPWLDLARFAETDGFEHDLLRPQAWRYRDWVIQAFNADLPLDQFIRWQIAGDILEPDNPAATVATGFLLAGPDMPDLNLQDERRHIFLNELTSTVGSVFLGLQLGCAQCHHHKFDPVSQHDFYRLRACFESAEIFKDHPLPGVKDKVRVMRERTEPVSSHLWVRGDFRRQGSVVEPGLPRIVPEFSRPHTPPAEMNPREYLARWIADGENALVTRVLVNRVWQQHFGQGLCRSPSDFGIMGEEPKHLELLDWLAGELPRRQWSLKQLHRLIVTSATWRQASYPAAPELVAPWQRNRQADPDNKLFSRQNRLRLDGEAIRDSLLQITGLTSQRRGGPGVRPPLPPELVATLLKDHWEVSQDREDHYRKSIYVFARRNLNYPLFGVFDQPARTLSCARRMTSTTAPQALELLNSQLTRECADTLADRLRRHSADPAEQVRQAYQLTLNRPPGDAELRAATAWITESDAGLSEFCLALFNLNEFVYVD